MTKPFETNKIPPTGPPAAVAAPATRPQQQLQPQTHSPNRPSRQQPGQVLRYLVATVPEAEASN